MAHSPLLILHICSAIIGLLSGWAGLFFRKGSHRHRAAGKVFFVSMLSMCGSAVSMAIMKQQTMNVIAGVLTFYLVGTAWLTMRRKAEETGGAEFGAMLVASAVGAAAWVLGWQVHSATSPKDGVPAVVYFVFGSVALLSAGGTFACSFAAAFPVHNASCAIFGVCALHCLLPKPLHSRESAPRYSPRQFAKPTSSMC